MAPQLEGLPAAAEKILELLHRWAQCFMRWCWTRLEKIITERSRWLESAQLASDRFAGRFSSVRVEDGCIVEVAESGRRQAERSC